MSSDPRLSLAIPLYNERQVFPELLERVGKVLDTLPGGPHQMVFVDDGSTDGTGALLAEAAAADPRVLAISLSRNFGHQAAFTAALDHADGDLVVVMDGDLQDPPEVIPELVAKRAEGYDVVYTRRVGRKEGLLLRLCYVIFYRLIALLSRVDLPLDAGDFSLLTREVVEALKRTPERHRYLRGLRSWVGFRQGCLPVERGERRAGESKYGPVKLLRLAGDGIFSFSTAPLRAAVVLGAIGVAAALLFVAYALYAKLVLGEETRGFTALIVTMVFSLGIILIFLGVIGEYVGRIYDEVKGRPHYLVRRIHGRRREREE